MNNLGAHAALLTAAVIYSGFNLLMSAAFRDAHASPVGLSLVRESACILVLYTWAHAAEGPLLRPSSGDAALFAALGLTMACFQLCFAMGIALTDGHTAALFQCVEPTTAAVLGALTGAERFGPHKVAAAALAGGGVLCIELSRQHPSDAMDSEHQVAPASWRRPVGSGLLFMQVLYSSHLQPE